MSDNTQILTVQTLLLELKEVDDWYLFGAYLGVPVYKLKEIQSTSQHRGVERCKLEMLQFWLDSTMTASWKDIVRAVEQTDRLTLASNLKSKYLWKPFNPLPEGVLAIESGTAEQPAISADVEADVKVVRGIQDLESSFSKMLLNLTDTLANCNISKMQFFFNDLFDTDEFSNCDTIEKVLRQLRQGHVDTFNIYYLQQLISQCKQSDDVNKSFKEYEERIDKFLEDTTVKEFQQAIVSRAETLPPKGMAEMTIRIPSMCKIKNLRTMKDVEELAKRSFQGCEKSFINIKVKPGSIVITWYVPESLCKEIERLACENAAVLREEGVEEMSIVGEKRVFFTQEKCLEKYNLETTVQEQEAVIAHLKARLKNSEEMLNDKKRMVEMVLKPYLGTLPVVQANGEGKEIANAGQKTSIELRVSSKATSSHISPLDLLSCQLIDPNFQHVGCSITFTQPDMATVTYTPTLRGTHHMKITVGNTDIPGSPFSVSVRPSLEMRNMPINAFPGVHGQCVVAVNKNGKIVVSERFRSRISVFTRDGNMITRFGSAGSSKGQFDSPDGVAITTDNYILVADSHNHRIQMFTMEGEFVRSVGEKGTGSLQFDYPSGIAFHLSGLVFIVEEQNHRIQVLNPDLSFSHIFGSKGSGPGQFSLPDDVACDSSGIVYVTDYSNHRVQSFSADGKFIAMFGSEGAKPGQFYYPCGICIDYTDTVYITDGNDRVSAFSTCGQFLKCFGKRELYTPDGIAVDNNTGNIYVCDDRNDCIFVY